MTVITITPEMEKEYVQLAGVICPHCRRRTVEAFGAFEADGATATQKAECTSCGTTWLDCWTLTGMINLEAKE